MKALSGLAIVGVIVASADIAGAGTIAAAYTALAEGTTIDLSAEGTIDWIKFGNGEDQTTSFLNTTKIGNLVFDAGSLAPLNNVADDELIAFTGGGILNFTWDNGNFGMYNEPGPVDTVVTETLVPAANQYPIGLGASFQASAAAEARTMRVYVQGFNADMLIKATMSGGGEVSVVVEPTENPASDPTNFYSIGVYEILYAGAGETITVSVMTQTPVAAGTESAFPNAGFFAATVAPEPSSLVIGAAGVVPFLLARRRHREQSIS